MPDDSPDEQTDPDATQEPAEDTAPPETDWAAEARKWEKRAKDHAAKLKAAEPQLIAYANLQQSQQTAEQQAQATAQAAEARVVALTQRAVRAEVRALAADGFTDPDDAAAFLDLQSYVGDDADIDTVQIRADLTDLLKRKPHLGKAVERRAPRPDTSQASGATSKATGNPAEEFAAIVRRANAHT